MIHRLLYFITGFLPCRIINIHGRSYMERYELGSIFGRRFYLHRFLTGDNARWLHDHPWAWSVSVILTGWYAEDTRRRLASGTVSPVIRKRRGWGNVLNGVDFHKISVVRKNTWTLFAHGPRVKNWGFLAKLNGHWYYSPMPYERPTRGKDPVGRRANRASV